MKHVSTPLAVLLLCAALAACDSIGEGSTIERLDIVPAQGVLQLKPLEAGDSYKLFQCLRDELIAQATFTDGTQVNFSSRVTWSSSDDTVVQVSNADIPYVLLVDNPANDGSFYESDSRKYNAGTVIPKGAPGQTATITVRFGSLSASRGVSIRKPTLRIVAVPAEDAVTAVPPYYLGQGTTRRLTLLVDGEGRTATAAGLQGQQAGINPFRWVFSQGTFVPQDPDVDLDVDQWVVDAGANRVAQLSLAGSDGSIKGVTADPALYEVSAETSLCPALTTADPTLAPVADIKVAPFYDDPGTAEDDRLVLSAEAGGFNGDGFAADDIVIGTTRKVTLLGMLDANGDGSLIVPQDLTSQAAYVVRPQDSGCEDDDTLLGCSANGAFTVEVTAGVLAEGGSPAEGDVSRTAACFPACLPPRATLDAAPLSVGTGVAVNFTATAVDVPPGTALEYEFDFGDGTPVVRQPGNTASHSYATANSYTATVRLVDAAFPAEFLGQNAGAVRILAGVTPPGANTAPTARITVPVSVGITPFRLLLDGSGSSDPDSGDAVTVYEFDPGDGTPVIRQTSSRLTHTYMGDGSFTPKLTVYDESGVASAQAAVSLALTVTGSTIAPMQSNRVQSRARDARLCSVELLPGPVAATSQAAFTFPGFRFEAIGKFVADASNDACTDPVIGTQKVTRLAFWAVRPAGVDDELSGIARIASVSDLFVVDGQVFYLSDVASPTTLDVTATVDSETLSADGMEATPTTLTVTPCPLCVP